MSNYATYIPNSQGWQLMTFSLEMAMSIADAWSETTTLAQLQKGLAFWQARQNLPAFSANAATCIPWFQTELARVQNPPQDPLHIVSPV